MFLTKVMTVVERIVDFNRLNNVEQRTSANVDILNGDHVTDCSGVDDGIFVSILIDASASSASNADRDNLTLTPRSFNFATHALYLSAKSSAPRSGNFDVVVVLLLLLIFNLTQKI